MFLVCELYFGEEQYSELVFNTPDLTRCITDTWHILALISTMCSGLDCTVVYGIAI